MEIIISSLIAFASTNVDDIFVLMLFFGNPRYKTKEVVVGQYAGFAALIAISFVGSFIGIFISKSYIGLLGFMPIYLGIKSLIHTFKNKNTQSEANKRIDKPSNKHGNIFSVAAVTFANGGDNIGIYIPLFATLNLTGRLTMIFIFLCMVALWCWVGKYVSRHPIVAKAINRYGHIITPIVLVLLGIYILTKAAALP